MSEPHADSQGRQREAMGRAVKRRGLIAGAAAFAAGIVAKQTAQPVRAVNPPFLLNQSNAITDTTSLNLGSGATTTRNHLFFASEDGGRDTTFDAAVHGNVRSALTAGVFGASLAAFGTGVAGIAYGVTQGTGVFAKGTTLGVSATLTNSFGSGPPATANTVAVQGVNNATGSGGVGVKGSTTGSAPNTIGVWGDNGSTGANAIGVKGSAAGLGVLGISTGSYGVLGVSTQPGFAGLTGITTTPSVPAFAGGSGVAGALAAQFSGGVFIDCTTVAGAQFVVNPMSAKFGTVQHHDGSLRLMASMEAPESWAVDIGAGQLTGGHATVTFDADYAGVIHSADYRVSLTPEGDGKGLFVSNKTVSGFEVHEQQGGTSSVGFTWVVYAHPRNQKGARLAKYEAPTRLKLEIPKSSEPLQPAAPPKKP